MMYVKITGGLGNQLFQYAAAYAVAKRRNQALRLDIAGYGPTSGRTPDILDFDIKAEVASAEEIWRFRKPKGFIRRKLSAGFYKYIVDFYQAYYSGILAPGRFGYVDGYFHDARYFKDCVSDIASLRLKDESRVNDAASQLRDVTIPVSIHVRRGDYLDPGNAAILDVCGADYYGRAQHAMRERIGPFTPVVFSDDLAWTRQNLDFGKDAIFVDTLPLLSDPEEMVLMSRCRHHIVANSTFSWWGAWLNPDPEKIVMAPTPWTRRDDRASRNMVPKDWTKIAA